MNQERPIQAILARLAAAAALGRRADLAAAVREACAADCPPEALRETLLMISLFAGFPRTLDTLAIAREAIAEPGGRLPEAAEPGLPDDEGDRRRLFRERGRALFGAVYGPTASRVEAGLRGLDAELADWILEDAYGKVLSRPGLSAADRERLAVVLLAALSLDGQLVGHVRGALRCGATGGEILASLEAARDHVPPEMGAIVQRELAE